MENPYARYDPKKEGCKYLYMDTEEDEERVMKINKILLEDTNEQIH